MDEVMEPDNGVFRAEELAPSGSLSVAARPDDGPLPAHRSARQ